MIADWPATLPRRPLLDGFEESVPITAIRTEMDAGPAKLRNRYTTASYPVHGTLLLRSDAQKRDLREFFILELQGGTQPFTWLDSAGEEATFRFMADDPQTLRFEPLGGGRWKAHLLLEVLP